MGLAYLEKCRLIRQAFPLAAITTDVIVGFPGETEEEFQQTKAFLEECQLYEIHIFKYSRRKGTRADRMSGQVPETVKTERSQVLQELTAAQSESFRQAWKGHTADVLLEECTDGVWTGHTREYIEVQIPDAGYAAGDIVAVEL